MPQFHDFAGMAAHFQRIIAALPTARAAELDAIGAHVQATAVGKLGDYQPAAGPFAAWEALQVATLADRARKAAPKGGAHPDSPLLVTGTHIRDTIQRQVVGGTEVHIGSNDPVADYQERGTNRIPPRSFLGSALFEQSEYCRDRFMRRIHAVIQAAAA